MKKNNVTLLINSCDAYKDILDPFFELLHRYWNDLPFDIVLTTETLKYKNKYFSIKNVHPKDKKCSWTRRIYEALKEVNTDYVLFFLDDFFLFDHVNTKEIMKCVDYLKNDKDIVNFTYYPIIDGTLPCNFEGFRLRKQVTKYKICAIATLWNKNQFIKYVKDIDEDIWEFEVNGTIRSNTIYKDDKYYCVDNDNNKNIIPYDFTTLGLISGKWFKATVDLFNKEHINFDFDKRGIYDPALRGLNRAFISSFKIESYVIPNLSLSKYNQLIYYKKVFPNGKFNLTYDIKGAKKMIRLYLSEQSGFAVKNNKIVIEYEDKKEEEISINDIYGMFVVIDNMIVFNTYAAYMDIPIKDKKPNRIIYEGETVCPISEKLLKESFMKKTNPTDREDIIYSYSLEMDRNTDYYNPKENVVINPKIDNNVYSEKIVKSGKNKYRFRIENQEEHNAKLELSKSIFYSINKLSVYTNKHKKIIIEGLPKPFDGYYIIDGSVDLSMHIPKDTKFITVEFKYEAPMNKEMLIKRFIIENNLERKEKKEWKLKKIMKKLSGKIMGN